MKYFKVIIILCAALALATVLYGCKKKEEVPTAETAAETAATAAEEAIACPAPGEDLICEECGILFQGDNADKDYAAHMDEKHPETWAMMKDEFWEMREGGGEEAGTE